MYPKILMMPAGIALIPVLQITPRFQIRLGTSSAYLAARFRVTHRILSPFSHA
jgi:hypothetical protein